MTDSADCRGKSEGTFLKCHPRLSEGPTVAKQIRTDRVISKRWNWGAGKYCSSRRESRPSYPIFAGKREKARCTHKTQPFQTLSETCTYKVDWNSGKRRCLRRRPEANMYVHCIPVFCERAKPPIKSLGFPSR